MTACVMSVPILQFSDQNGAPLVGGKLYTYTAGTSTPQPLYTDVGLTTPFSNPIVLDAAGTLGGPAYTASVSYKYVLQDSNGVTLFTADNIAAVASV